MSATDQAMTGGPAGGAIGGAATMPDDAARTARAVLAMLLVVYFFSSVDRSIFGILAQPIKEELLLADWELGFLTGFAFSAVHLLFGFPMARLADKGNRVTILSVSVAFWSVMTALCGLSANFIQLVLFRMGVGVGEASCLPASHSLISDYFPRANRTKALAIYGLGYPGGAFVGMIVGGFVLDHWGWRAAFYVVGIPRADRRAADPAHHQGARRGGRYDAPAPRMDAGLSPDPAVSFKRKVGACLDPNRPSPGVACRPRMEFQFGGLPTQS